MKRRLLRIALILIMILMAAAVYAAAESADGATSYCDWKPDIRLGIAREYQLRQAAGMDLADWDEAVDAAKRDGLSAPISAEDIMKADQDALVLEENGLIYQIGPSSLFGQVTDVFDAYRLAYRLVETLGGTPDTRLMLKSKLSFNEKTIYSFQQIFDGKEVLGGTLKIALNGDNGVTAVFACIDPNAAGEQTWLTKAEAEAQVASRCRDEYGHPVQVLEEYTDRGFRTPATMVYSMNMDYDIDPIPDDLVWIVYTANEGAEEADKEYPYIAHYVKVDGTYVTDLPVMQPGDEESRCGFRKKDVFVGMTPDTYTGEIEDFDGNKRTVTVPVMRCEADNCWYLGDVERRIVFADYYECAYGENHDFVLLKSEDNADWDDQDIATLYNYLRARDFYANMGWNGPDGEGTDEVIFKGMCYSDGSLIENACSFGKLECWQVFSYSTYNAYGDKIWLTMALDIMAHEYTHTFTETVMNKNLYENDLGAINEAMSDIMGNLVEYICEDTQDEAWLIGEKMGAPFRCMSDPELYDQPTSVWGKAYRARTNKPNTVNDRGGVHYNSSLLSLIAAKLCLDHGMRYDEAVSFWVLTSMGMTPRTDYIQMSALLRWALKESGYKEAYGAALDQLIEQTRIETTDMPETLPEGQKLVRLALPDTETFTENKEWCLYIMPVKKKTDAESIADIAFTAAAKIQEAISDPESKGVNDLKKAVECFAKVMAGDMSEEDALSYARGFVISAVYWPMTLTAWMNDSGLYAWEELDTGVIPVVMDDKPAIYMLLNIANGGSSIKKILLLLDGSWFDITGISIGDSGQEFRDVVHEMLPVVLKAAPGYLSDPGEVGIVDDTSGAIKIEYLPSAGLEKIAPTVPDEPEQGEKAETEQTSEADEEAELDLAA